MDISGLIFDMLIFHIKFMMKFLYLFVKDSHNLGVLLFASLNFQLTFLFFVVDSRQLCLWNRELVLEMGDVLFLLS